ncbi:glycine zipper domain-containing protein [Minwuia sp.]|uniref:glycine zipper domain-containing protein n=1 Tax=Minwuia sp. TaxID=2493630 RepID=UPI003A93CAF6
MFRKTAIAGVLGLTLVLGACENMTDTQQRTLSGGALGTAGGAALTALTGGSVVAGAVIGGAVGAGAGYLTGKQNEDD